jgi:hypothetical protein
VIRNRFPLARTGLALAVSMAVGLLSAGCGSSGPQMASVSGKVTYKGQPLTKGSVSFVSTDPARPNASGAIQSDGSYTLQTREPGDGAQLGDYKVSVTDIDPEAYNTALPGEAPKLPKSAIPQKYENPETSGITQKVVSGSNKVDITLTD